MSDHNPNSPSHLKHYFHDVNQQYETSKFAMWAFILTEVLTSVSYTHLRAHET